ncbi:MAG: hypothetical protein Q9157_006402 [Trypethelium eluteriae]
MSLEENFIQQFEQSSQNYFSERIEYTSAKALLLYWKDHDLDAVEPTRPSATLSSELQALRVLLEQDLNFSTCTYEIPTEHSQQLLNVELSKFVAASSVEADTLTVIYYAGHCDSGKDGKARWSAQEVGGPDLSWHRTQRILDDAVGDVLLILDCCNAGQVSEPEKPLGKLELLAASGKKVLTPGPGPLSFTTLVTKMLQTPVYFDLARSHSRSITIRPLVTPKHTGFIQKPSSFILLKASLTDDPTGLQIAHWLKAFPPRNLLAVNIEAVVLKARNLQELHDTQAISPGSALSKLSPAAQSQILRELRGLHSVMADVESKARDDGHNTQSSQSLETSESYQSIESSISAVNNAVETGILIGAPNDVLKEAGRDKSIQAIAGVEAFNLREHILNLRPIPAELALPRGAVKLSGGNDRFQLGIYKQRKVVVEYFKYEEDPDSGMPHAQALEQLRRMTTLLHQPKKASYHILPCEGYIHEEVHRRFGLVFKLVENYNPARVPTSLSTLLKEVRKVPLGHRRRLALSLASALENLHRVGWVHKEYKSSNIFFLPDWPQPALTQVGEAQEQTSPTPCAPVSNVDLAFPWLFGFDYCRPESVESNRDADYGFENNVTRHPDRWNRPRVKFTKTHDVYSLGILLVEIAFWKNIASLLGSSNKPDDLEKFKIGILEKCRGDLPHQVGEVFLDVILACFNFGEATMKMSDFDAHSWCLIEA